MEAENEEEGDVILFPRENVMQSSK